MHDDPIIAEVHRIRQELLVECGGAIEGLVAHLRRCQQDHPERIVTHADLDRIRGKGNAAART